MKKLLFSAIPFLFLFISCSDSSTENTVNKAPAIPEGPIANIDIEAGDDMRFDRYEIKVRAGQKINLTLKHTGKLDIYSMGHNWVLLQSGSDIPSFAHKAAEARETEYIPESERELIIAHTGMIGGGDVTSVSFDAPPVGEYPFLCSFPAHFSMMKGILVVVPEGQE